MGKLITRAYAQTKSEKVRQVLLRRENEFVSKELIKIETGLTERQLESVFYYALKKGWIQKTYSSIRRIYNVWKQDYIQYGIGLKYKIIYTDLWTNLYSK